MGKQPYIAFYVGDWLKDASVSLCSPESRGVWIDFIFGMHELRSGGVLTGDKEQLCRIGRCSHAQLDRALIELQATRTADISERNGIYSVMCRRLRREAEISASRAKAASKSHSKREANSESEYEVEIQSEKWLRDSDFTEAWDEWQDYRTSVKKPLTPIAKLKQVRWLKSIGKQRAISAINHSIRQQWQGIYEPKPDESGGNERTAAWSDNEAMLRRAQG